MSLPSHVPRIRRQPHLSVRASLPPALVPVLLGHHGFGSFDTKVMYYIAGRVTRLEWADRTSCWIWRSTPA